MLNVTSKFFVFSLFLTHALTLSASPRHGELEGYYVPKKGWVESQELHPGETIGQQVGRFKIVLKRQGWASLSASEKLRIRKKLVISGVFHGLIENPQTAPVTRHQLSNNQRDGAIFTVNDTLTIVGFEPCSEEPGALTFHVHESLNLDYATGIYKDLQDGGNINLEGTINTCTLQNDLDVVTESGGLCFGSENCS